MKQDDIEKYVDKIYAYALAKTFSEAEAEELSQEILLTAITSLPKLRDENRFEPWLWGLAANVAKSFRRSMGRQRALFVYNAPETMLDLPVLYYVLRTYFPPGDAHDSPRKLSSLWSDGESAQV